jgi:hypothetical protein
MVRSRLATVLMVLSLASAACSSRDEGAAGLSEGQLMSAESLQEQTKLEAAVTVDEHGVARVNYVGDPAYFGPVRFEAVRFAPAAAGKVNVALQGDFPSNADVLVTDAAFHVIANTRTVPSKNGDSATLMAEIEEPGDHFVLVRDQDWQNPMTFEVAVDLSALNVAAPAAETK